MIPSDLLGSGRGHQCAVVGVVGMSSRVRTSWPWHACMPTHPACLHVASGCLETTWFTWHFDFIVPWSGVCRLDSVAGLRGTPYRGPFPMLSLAAMSLCHLVCFAGAIYGRRWLDTGPRERHKRCGRGIEWWRDLERPLHTFPWSVFSALFCCHALVASSPFRGRDMRPRVGRY